MGYNPTSLEHYEIAVERWRYTAHSPHREAATFGCVSVTSKLLNFTACPHYMSPSKTFCHASLPARPGGSPLRNNINRQTQGNKLPGTCRLGAATFFNHSTAK
jgi:hypothetical protein